MTINALTQRWDRIDLDDLMHLATETLRAQRLTRIEYQWWDQVPFPVLTHDEEHCGMPDHTLVDLPELGPALTPRQLHAQWRRDFFIGGPPGAERRYRDEAAVVEAILKWLKRLGPTVAYAYKVWGGGVYAHAGAHDITGALAGRRFEIEVKHRDQPMTAHQAEECGRWRRAGVTAFYTNSLEGAQRGLADLLIETGVK